MPDPFTDDMIAHAGSAHDHGGRPKPTWSVDEKLAIALVLDNQAHLRSADYTVAEARQRPADDLMGRNVDAWLANVRSAF